MNKEKKNINVENVDDDTPFVNKFAKVIILFLVALMLVAVNFFVEYSFVQEVVSDETIFDEFDYSIENEVFDFGFVRFEDEKELTVKNNVKLLKAEGDDYIFEMYSGKMWDNFKLADANVNIIVDRLVLIPDHAIFSVEYDKKKIDIKVFDGDVYLGILPEDGGIISYSDQFSDVYVNRMVLPRRTEVSIALSKLDSRVQTLLVSKLVKEFKYAPIPQVVFERKWVDGNLLKDSKFLSGIKRNYISNIIAHDVKTTSIDGWIDTLEDKLVFNASKKQKIKNKRFTEKYFKIMNFARTLDSNNDSDVRNLRTMILKLDKDSLLFKKYLNSLKIFAPYDPEYLVFKIMQLQIFNPISKSDLLVLDAFWLDIYDAVSEGSVYGYDAFSTYLNCFNKYDFKLYSAEDRRKYFTFLNRKLYNLFIVNSEFFTDEAFEFKSNIERLFLNLYPEGSDKDEVIQTLISNKIVLLKRLKKFYFSEEIVLSDAILVYERLVGEINDYIEMTSSQNAVLDKFRSQLDKLSSLYGYMKSSEYNSSTSHGITHDDRYKAYIYEKDIILNFLTVTDDIEGQVISTLTLDDVRDNILAEFEKLPGLDSISVEKIDSIDQRYVSVSGSVDGYPFEVDYDRDFRLLSKVDVYGNSIIDAPITIKSLPVVISKRFAEDVVEDDSDSNLYKDAVIESSTQHLAKLYLVDKLKNVGIDVSEKDVIFVGGVVPTYRIINVKLVDPDGIVQSNGNSEINNDVVYATFDFEITGEVVKNLILNISGETVPLDGDYKIVDLPDLMINDYSFSGDGEGGNTDDILGDDTDLDGM